MPPKKNKVGQKCIIHFKEVKDAQFTDISVERLEKLKEISKTRLKLPEGSNLRYTEVCCNIPENISPGDGYHRKCYNKFTVNLHRIKGEEEPQVSKLNQTERSKLKIKLEQDKTIFKENCIFCNKEGKKARKGM